MKLIHLSDIHLTKPGEPLSGPDPHARLDLALRDIARNHADAERLVISGDLTNLGERETFEALRDRLRDVALPVRLLMGNHDDREAFLKVFPDHPRDANGFINHAEDVGGARFIYLDTLDAGKTSGRFGADRLDWLRAELEGCARARLFLHHPPMALGLPAADKIALAPEDQPGLHALLESFADRIEYMHFGHLHTPISGMFRGIPFSCVPSTVDQSIPDLNDPDCLRGGAMDPGYSAIVIEGGNTFIHRIPFAWDGQTWEFRIGSPD